MTPVFISLVIFGMALMGIEVSRSAAMNNLVGASGLLIWPLGEPLSVPPREGTSHGGTATRIGNGTVQQADLLDREWALIQIGDRSVQAGSGPRAYFRLVSGSRKVEGFTGCNGLQGHFESADRNVRFVGLATTRKFCPGLMEQERAFLTGLERTRLWNAEDGQLVLMNEDHEAVLMFKAHPQ